MKAQELTIIGRVKEKEILKQIFQSQKSEFLALYGRRRVGKTFLIKNFFSHQPGLFFYSSGLKNGKLKDQIKSFTEQIGLTFYQGANIATHKTWKETFEELNKAMAQVDAKKKIVLFFDELPWMATPRSSLLETLDYYWNRYWSHDARVKLIICGSSASWIVEKIINNKGGLYNRVTRTMRLEPFSLAETQEFLSALGIHLNQQQVLDLYMVFGGIPHYLSLIKKGLSAVQNIDELCFQKSGALVDEFERLFFSLFDQAETYIKLVRTIAKHPLGIGQATLIKEAKVSDGGNTKTKLLNLEQAGLIMEFVPYGHQAKGLYYKIADEFILFYLRFMEPALKSIAKQDRSTGYWLAKSKSPSWLSWAGLAFESICYKHLFQIRKALQINATALVGSWRYIAEDPYMQGAQIDLLFDREDGVITLCEIKYYQTPYTIDRAAANNLIHKIEAYRKKTKTTKQLFLVIIAAHGLKPSIYSEDMVDQLLTLTDLFK